MKNETRKEKNFVEGMTFSVPREGAPDFVRGGIAIKPEALIEWMRTNKQHLSPKGWYFIDLKKSQKGNLYLELNTYRKPEEKKDEQINPEDIPF